MMQSMNENFIQIWNAKELVHFENIINETSSSSQQQSSSSQQQTTNTQQQSSIQQQSSTQQQSTEIQPDAAENLGHNGNTNAHKMYLDCSDKRKKLKVKTLFKGIQQMFSESVIGRY